MKYKKMVGGIRITDDCYDSLKREANEAGISYSELIRQKLEGNTIIISKEQLKAMIKEINMIGHNINQVTKRVNSLKGHDRLFYSESINKLHNELQKIKGILCQSLSNSQA